MRLILVILALGAVAAPAFADSPQAYTISSPNGLFVAVLDPIRADTRVYRVSKGSREMLWSMNGWYRAADLADDGRHLVVGADGLDLVPVNYDPGDPIITIYDRGYLVRQVPIEEIVRPRDMVRISSYYYWGTYRGFDDSGNFTLETLAGTLRYDVSTGAQVR